MAVLKVPMVKVDRTLGKTSSRQNSATTDFIINLKCLNLIESLNNKNYAINCFYRIPQPPIT
jgi:hypothetical protein